MARKGKVEEEEKPVEEEKEEGAEAEEGAEKKVEEKKPRFKMSAGVVGILRYVLLGLLVVILSFTVSFFVARGGGGGSSKSMTKDELMVTDPNTGDVIERLPKGADWNMDTLILNTSDEDEQHIIRAQVIISYEKESKTILAELNDRKSQIHNDVRTIIGSKKYIEVNTTRKQEDLKREIKARIQLIVNQEGIIEVFFKEFTVH